MHVRAIAATLDGGDRPAEQIPRLHVQLEYIGRTQLVEDPLESRAVRSQQEELGPEAVGFFGVVALRAVALARARPYTRIPRRDVSSLPGKSATNLRRGRLAGCEGTASADQTNLEK